MKNRIVWKLAACFAAVLFLFTAVLGTVFVSMFRQHTISLNRTAMEKEAISISETLSSFEMGITGMGRGGRGGYGAYVRFLNELAMAEVWIVDENLNLLTPGHWNSTVYGKLPENAEQIVKRVFEGEITYGEEFSSLLETPTLTVGAPIITKNGVTGAVLLHSPISGVNEAVRQGQSALIGGIIAALALAGVAAVWLSYRFTKPLSRMKTAALCLADGNYSALTGVKQSDEIGQLAEAIDSLADRLSLVEQERASLDRLKQDFVANVSHELRTPVAVLRGSIEVLKDGTVSGSEEVSDYYEQMLAESRHLERLVNDLLDLSRLQDAQFHLELAEMNLCDVLRDTVRAVRRLAKEKNLELIAECPVEECIIQGDYGRIRQLLLILLDNAVKFSPEKGTVKLSVEKESEIYRLMVTNEGQTIPPEELCHIFERFYKTQNQKNHSGTGLGLVIAKQIAARHGGDVNVESKDGTTKFWVEFLSF